MLAAGVFAGEAARTDVPAANAASVPTGFTDGVVASGISNPTAMALAPDGRIFVAQQGGSLRVIKNGSLLATPFLTVTVNSTGERGLLGVAFDPNFASNNFVYVYYTATSPTLHNRVSRFTANGDVAVAGSEQIILDLDNLSGATNHNGGALHFGIDGKLYIGVGDNANGGHAQSMSTLHGKMLRINADGSIPADNPFYASTTGKNRAIWALGLRNPFSFNVQPGTGRIFINDVGQSAWEEINDGIAGSNYGWPSTEGETTNPAYRSPLYAYGHGSSATTGCAITGGAFYNPTTAQFPADYIGDYFYADYCSNWIRRYDVATDTTSAFATNASAPVDLQVGADGTLYYLSIGTGSVGRIRYEANPTISQHPQSQLVSVGSGATFSVTASGPGPLSYQWQRNGVNIGGATSSSYTINSAQMSDNGAVFRCVVSNSFGSATSNGATLSVTNSQPPTAAITQPAGGTQYDAGQTVSYAGTGTDPEDGSLPGSAFTWSVVFHHATHTHPFIAPSTGATGGSFVIPNTGETAANVWYRIHLTVQDSSGLTHSTFRDITPRTSTITLQSSPGGMQLTLDGQPVSAPHAVSSVVGMQRSIGAVTPQTSGSTTYTFGSWSDGGTATHTITTPASNTTYTATFAATATTTVTFDDRAGQNQVLDGQYPTGLINWGTSSQWYHSAPFGLLTTKNFTFNGPSINTATFTFVSPRQLLTVQAYNGGAAATLTFSCPGQTSKVQSIGAGQLLTVSMGWTGTCTTVTINSTNGWDTNFDNIVVANSTPDTTPPTVSITAPAANADVSGTVPLNASASDAGGISKVRFWAGSQYLGYDTTAPYSKTWNTTGLQNGRYTLKIQAFDNANNSTVSTIVVTVKNPDTTPPAVAITNPAAGATVSGTVSITATASDNLGVEKVRFYVGNVYLGYDASAPYSKAWNTTTFSNGTHVVRAQAVDWLGNVTNTTITVTVSN